MTYKIEDVYNIAEQMHYYKEENVVRGTVSVDLFHDNEPFDTVTREYEINKNGLEWTSDEDPLIDWDLVRFEVDEAFFNHFKNVDKIWRQINER